MLQDGKLKSWNEAKGFGFIQSSSLDKDIFLHVSSLRHMPRSPRVGDTIVFQVEAQNNGKLKAYNCSIQGLRPVPIKPKQTYKPSHLSRPTHSKRGFGSIAIGLFIILSILFSYSKYEQIANEKTTHEVVNQSFPESNSLAQSALFQCEGKQHCSQMASCEEAKFYLKNCPSTKIDGDNDGIPCERQHCTSFWD